MYSRGQSFLRAWAPCLEAHNISQADFLAFIDNLNIVSTANPPLQVLNLAGGFLVMVPHHWVQIAGTAVQASAQLGTAVKIFKPRGLKVGIASIEAMPSILRIPDTQPLLAPLTRETIQLSTVERELLAVREYNGVLELNVPRPLKQTTMVAKLSARQIGGLAKKNQKKAVEDRENALEKKKAGRREDEKWTMKGRKEEKRDRKRNRKHDKKDEQSDFDDDDDDGSDTGPVECTRKQEKKRKQGKEEKSAGKVLWIVIENF